jgi:hypothetical protein
MCLTGTVLFKEESCRHGPHKSRYRVIPAIASPRISSFLFGRSASQSCSDPFLSLCCLAGAGMTLQWHWNVQRDVSKQLASLKRAGRPRRLPSDRQTIVLCGMDVTSTGHKLCTRSALAIQHISPHTYFPCEICLVQNSV